MKTALALASLAVVLTACQSPDLRDYHPAAAHPFQMREQIVRLPLAGVTAEAAATNAVAFGLKRPNNGSTFVVLADETVGPAVRAALMAGAGVDPRDIVVAVLPEAPEIMRTDRQAIAAGCYDSPQVMSGKDYLTKLDDGLNRSNTDSKLYGCSVRRNIAAMTDDPRTLFGPVHSAPRDGAIAGNVYGKYVKGEPTYSKSVLPTTMTTESTLSAGSGGSMGSK